MKAFHLRLLVFTSSMFSILNCSAQVTRGDGPDHEEDEFVEPRLAYHIFMERNSSFNSYSLRYEEVPGTLEHLTELIVEKELRLRLPLQELEVLLEP